MKIISIENGWIYGSFTWRQLGGILMYWKDNVTNGEIHLIHSEELEKQAGEYYLVE